MKSIIGTEDDARKMYGVDFLILKKANNKAQKYILTLEVEQPL